MRKEELSDRFTEAWQKIDNLYNAYAKSRGLSFSAIIILECLDNPNAVYTQKELCEKFGLPKQAVNSIIKSFWEQNYVELKEAKDRRNKEMFLTAKGKAYAKEILEHYQQVETKTWEYFTPEELQAFTEAMEKYEKSFERVAFS